MIQQIGTTRKDSPATAVAGVVRRIPHLPEESFQANEPGVESRQFWDLLCELEFLYPIVLGGLAGGPVRDMFAVYERNLHSSDIWWPTADEAFRLVHAFYTLSDYDRRKLLNGWAPTPFPVHGPDERSSHSDSACNDRIGQVLILNAGEDHVLATRCADVIRSTAPVTATILQGVSKHVALKAMKDFTEALDQAWDSLVGSAEARSVKLPLPSPPPPSPAIAHCRRAKRKTERASPAIAHHRRTKRKSPNRAA